MVAIDKGACEKTNKSYLTEDCAEARKVGGSRILAGQRIAWRARCQRGTTWEIV